MDTKWYDVVVIGAGAAGLMAALELALAGKTVAVIEASHRTGGRINTIPHPRFEKPVELGAEFVHGDLPLTLQLFKEAGIKKIKSGGEVWQYKGGLKKGDGLNEGYDVAEKKCKDLADDISVADFMMHYLGDKKFESLRYSLTRYVQGYYAGDIAKAGTRALCEELSTGEDVNYRVTGGYRQLVTYLEGQCKSSGVKIFLSDKVKEIKWRPGDAEVLTDKSSFFAAAVLVTVSVGVLQSEIITFTPTLPQHMAVIKKLGFGHVVKINLQFSDAFWKNKSFTQGKTVKKMNFLFSDEAIPTWWTQHPQDESLLVGWLSGPPAEAYIHSGKEQVIKEGLTSLATIFSVDVSVLEQKLVDAEWYNWSADKNFCGAYSYNVVDGGALINTMLEPIAHTIYFAGEGLCYGNQIGTVEAALKSGRNIAQQLIADLTRKQGQ